MIALLFYLSPAVILSFEIIPVVFFPVEHLAFLFESLKFILLTALFTNQKLDIVFGLIQKLDSDLIVLYNYISYLNLPLLFESNI